MKFRLYAADMVGAGTLPDPYRNIIFDYKQIGEKLSVFDMNHRMFSICLLEASEATHTAVNSLTETARLSPLSDDYPGLISDILTPWTSFPEAVRTAAFNKIETDGGISLAWIGPETTVKNIIRYILKCQNFIHQRIRGEKKLEALQFFKEHLDDTVKDFTAEQRNEVKTWMESKGLTADWVSPNTTVREVLHYIVENLSIGSMHFTTKDGSKVEI